MSTVQNRLCKFKDNGENMLNSVKVLAILAS